MTTATVQRDVLPGNRIADGAQWSRFRAKPRHRIPHLLLGLVLVVVCTTASVLMATSADERQAVAVLAHTVTVGHVLGPADLRQVDLVLDSSVSAVSAADIPTVVGRRLATSLPAGALLPEAALSGSLVPAPGAAIVAMALKDGQIPPEVSAGAKVSVVLPPEQEGSPGKGKSWTANVVATAESSTAPGTVVSLQLAELDARDLATVPTDRVAVVLLAVGEP